MKLDQLKIDAAGRAIAEALMSVSTDDRGWVLLEAAIQLRRQSQYATASLLQKAGHTYNGA